MKKPKIKPEVVWMPWCEGTGFLIKQWAYSKGTCLERFARETCETWDTLRKKGCRVVKVEVREVK